MKKLFGLIVLAAAPLAADSTALRMLQSGEPFGPMSLHLAGVDGRGEIIAVLDTGADVDSCAFAETDGSLPPVNTGTPTGGLEAGQVDHSRRKVIAYNFLFSCDQYPGVSGCDDPRDPRDWDNLGHGTIAASLAAGNRAPFSATDEGDGMAPGAQLIIQDAGFLASSACQIPGLGCPPRDVRSILQQAHLQGARIQSHQWGDRMGSFSELARQIDEFAHENPEAVIVFNSGNAGEAGERSVISPGLAKNTIQVGGTRSVNIEDAVVWERSGRGPTDGGRIKPDLVVPSYVYGSTGDGDVTTGNCEGTFSAGTSWSAPLVAGAAAVIRQFYREGRQESGEPSPSRGFEPSAALVKATLVASTHRVPFVQRNSAWIESAPTPSGEQGFGFPVLGRVLPTAPSSARLLITDDREGLAPGGVFERRVEIRPGGTIRIALTWTDPPSADGSLVHDLDLELIGPSGQRFVGNAALTGGTPDRMNNVEKVEQGELSAGVWTIRVRAERVTGAQPFALVISGDLEPEGARRRLVRRR